MEASSTQPISQQSSGAQRPRRRCRAALGNDSYVTAGSYPSEVFVPGAAGEMLTFNKYLRKLAPTAVESEAPGALGFLRGVGQGVRKREWEIGGGTSVVCSYTRPISQ